MTQLFCELPDDIAAQLYQQAMKKHISVSSYLAQLIEKDTASSWPTDYFEQVFGQWEGTPLQRPSQGSYEQRALFK